MKRTLTQLLLISVPFFIARTASAQCDVSVTASDTLICSGDDVTITANPPGTYTSLVTTYSAGNNHRGNMFDIQATNQVVIDSFAAHPMGNTTIEIYYRPTPFAGYEASSAGWTLIGSAAVTAQPSGTPTMIPVDINVTIPAGQTYSFYVTSANTAVSLNYSDGTSQGAVYASDANISFLQGVGLEYPFTAGGGTFSPRIWNGTIYYSIPVATTYSWSTGATTQSISETLTSSTQYTVTIDASGCPSQTETIEILVSEPNIDAGMTQTVCYGDTVTLSGSGGIGYFWDNGVSDGVPFSATSTTLYTVNAIDTASCPGSDTVTVHVNDLPAVDAGMDVDACSGSDITLTGTGASSYSWNNGVTNGMPFEAMDGDYIVTGTDANGCVNSDTMHVSVIEVNDSVIQSGVVLSADASGAAYQWYDCATWTMISGATSQTYTPTANGSYAVVVTENGCSDTSECMAVSTVGLEEVFAAAVSVNPNPTNGQVKVHCDQVKAREIILMNAQGEVLETHVPNGSETTIDLGNYASGVYLIRISTDAGTVLKKIIRN